MAKMVHKAHLILTARSVRTIQCSVKRVIVVTLLMFVTVLSLLGTGLAAKHYRDPKTAEDSYCQQNKFVKDQMGQEDFLDDPTTVCMSSIVLEYSVEHLESPLRATYMAQAVTGALLAATAPPALVGALFDQLRVLLVIWAAADIIWCITLVVSAVVLAPFGFPTFVPMLAGSAAVCLLLGIVVLCFGLKKRNGQEHSDWIELSKQDQHRGQQDPKRGEQDEQPCEQDQQRDQQDHQPCEEEAMTGESMSRNV